MDTEITTVAISGGGPAGVTLGLLLARAGVDVTILEKHPSFLNDFRGDTVHPSTLRVLDELGLGDEVERVAHRKIETITIGNDDEGITSIRLDKMSGSHPYVSMIPQMEFLNMLVTLAKNYPSFRLLMNARSTGLIREDGVVRGVTYTDERGEHELRAALTVSADGRRSDLRAMAGLEPTELGSPMDVLWFRVSRDQDGLSGLHGRTGDSAMAFAVDRGAYWQVAYVIRKGGFDELLTQPIGVFQERLANLLPFLADHLGEVDDWEKVAFLNVALNRLKRWYLPGYLCIGDAAHAMTPVGGVGVNLAVQDAVAAANILAEPLHRAQLGGWLEWPSTELLRRVQRRRWLPDAGTQLVQKLIQRQLFGRVLSGAERKGSVIGAKVRNVVYSRVITRVMMQGIRPEHVRSPERV